MLRASCDRCHRDKAKCQFEPGASLCVRCQHRKRRCVRSPPMPPGRAKTGTKANVTNTSRAGGQSGEEATVLAAGVAGAAGGFSQSFYLATYAQTAAGPGTQEPARGDLLGSRWWGSPSLGLEPAMPSWDPGNNYSQLSFFAEPSLSPDESTPASFPSEGTQGNSTYHLVADELDAVSRCQCSVSLGRFLENGFHPCLSSDPPLAFDVVLNTNRAITSAVRELAECWNSHPPNSMMLVYLLAQSVLASLHEAWWSSCRPGQQYPLPQAGSDSRQVFIGSYRMDEEDSTVFRRQIVLLELERVQQTLCLLQERVHMEPDVEGVHSFATKFLVAEVRRIVNRISEQQDL